MVRFFGVGQNFVLPQHYGGWEGALGGCQADIAGHSQLALRIDGCVSSALVTSAPGHNPATRATWREKITQLADEMDAGDFLYYVHSHHGSTDEFGQGLVLADGIIYENEFRERLARFKAGVQILCFMDLCHSGGLMIPGKRSLLDNPGKPRGATFKDRTKPDETGRGFLGMESKIKASLCFVATALTTEYAYDGSFVGDFGRGTAGWLACASPKKSIAEIFTGAKGIVSGQTLNMSIHGEGNPNWIGGQWLYA